MNPSPPAAAGAGGAAGGAAGAGAAGTAGLIGAGGTGGAGGAGWAAQSHQTTRMRISMIIRTTARVLRSPYMFLTFLLFELRVKRKYRKIRTSTPPKAGKYQRNPYKYIDSNS